jgi:small subunit ribosomal protein S12
MPTLCQIRRKRRFLIKKNKRNKNNTPALKSCPQKKGYCLRIFTTTPRKPNSALRKVARLLIISTGMRVTGYIRGIGHSLQKHSNVLIQGGNIPDLPGIKYRLIRGKFDLKGVKYRLNARSKYGVKKRK